MISISSNLRSDLRNPFSTNLSACLHTLEGMAQSLRHPLLHLPAEAFSTREGGYWRPLKLPLESRQEWGCGSRHRFWAKQEQWPFPDVKIQIEQLAEAVELIKRIWTQEKTNFHGKYYTARDLVSYLKPLQKPHPPISVGGKGDKLLTTVACWLRQFWRLLCGVVPSTT